jgi:polysaccharide biosynthesis protein PelD
VKTVAASPASTASKQRNSNVFGNVGRLRRIVAPAVARPFSIVETIAFTLAVLALCAVLSPKDPLLLQSGFPWLWSVPLIVSLRYGTLLGLLSGALVACARALSAHTGAAWPTVFFAGGALQTIIAGHFGDTWGNRAARATALNNYLNDRLAALTNSHYLLRLSHERLEKDLLSKPTTLRDAITALRRLSVMHGLHDETAAQSSETSMPGGQALLEFVAQACQIDVAALYRVDGGRIAREPLASVGDVFELDVRDELVERSLETRHVAHLMSADEPLRATQLLVCAPLVAAGGSMLGLLAIKRMPFLSLHFDNLQLLLVLLGYYADGVDHAPLVGDVLRAVPNCPADFALDVGRLTRLARESRIVSSLVALVFPRDEAGDSFFEHVMRRRRSLDLIWPISTTTASVIVNLMPATDGMGVDGYLARIEASLDAQFQVDLEGARIGVHTLRLGDAEPGPALQRLLVRSGIDV